VSGSITPVEPNPHTRATPNPQPRNLEVFCMQRHRQTGRPCRQNQLFVCFVCVCTTCQAL